MKKKTQRIDPKLKAFVRECFKKYAWNIGVSHYQGDIHYMAEPDTDDGHRGVTLATMTTDRRYLRATLRIFPLLVKKWKEGEKDYVSAVIAHEVGHLATQHLYDVAVATYRDDGEMKDAWETLTEVVGRMAHKIAELEEKRK